LKTQDKARPSFFEKKVAKKLLAASRWGVGALEAVNRLHRRRLTASRRPTPQREAAKSFCALFSKSAAF
jgi:hypothetical protein